MKYTQEHEWVRLEGDEVVVGITDYAAQQLGDVVYIELPEVGSAVSKGDEIVVIESVKVASDITAPLEGAITAINETLEGAPDMVNKDPHGAGWFFKMTLKNPSDFEALMDEETYRVSLIK